MPSINIDLSLDGNVDEDSNLASVITLDETESVDQPKRKKRKIVQKEPDSLDNERFVDVRVKYPWVKNDSAKFLQSGNVDCSICSPMMGTDLNVLTFNNHEDTGEKLKSGYSSGNLTKHQMTAFHQKKAAAKNASSHGLLKHLVVIPEASTMKDVNREIKILREYVDAAILALGVNPHQSNQLFANGGIVKRGMDMLTELGQQFGTEYMMREDCNEANKRVIEYIKEKLKGEDLAIITDSASLKSSSAIAVLASSTKLGVPVLLKIIPADERSFNADNLLDLTYNFELAALDVNSVLVDMVSALNCYHSIYK
jgi:hypothetical protein